MLVQRVDPFPGPAPPRDGTSGTFNVYREQPISCIGNVVSVSAEEEYPGYVFNSDEVTVLWSDIYPAHDFGDRAVFHRRLLLQGWKN